MSYARLAGRLVAGSPADGDTPSLVWIMTGIAAGIAGGWLWNRERAVDVAPSAASACAVEPIRLALHAAARRARTYLTPSDSSAPSRRQAQPSSEFSHRQSIYDSASHADREQLAAMIADARAPTNPVERRNTLESCCCVTQSSMSLARLGRRSKTIARRRRICWQR